MDIIRLNEIEERIIVLRNIPVLLDSDVACLYGVETKEVNQAVKNNPNKFPKGYVFELDNKELTSLRSKILTTNLSKTRVPPKAFTEKGCYMLATILKGEKAEETTIKIIETFARIRELSRNIKQIVQEPEGEKRNLLLEKGGEIVSAILDNDLEVSSIERSFEINLAAIKFKQVITKQKPNVSK
ncbi:MAG: ORF6N domain-containing protein [Lentimicrobiaceae bacterium]|nr:ORF6N domain-containing protein [Lentimicrobiaceae bacterium]